PKRLAKADLQLLEAGGVLLRINASGRESLHRAFHPVAIALELSERHLFFVFLQIRTGLLDFIVAQFSKYFGPGHGIVLQLILRLILRTGFLRGSGAVQAETKGHARHNEKAADKFRAMVWIPSHFRRRKAASLRWRH